MVLDAVAIPSFGYRRSDCCTGQPIGAHSCTVPSVFSHLDRFTNQASSYRIHTDYHHALMKDYSLSS